MWGNRYLVPLLAVALTVLALDVAVIVASRPSAPPVHVAVMGHVVERGPSAPRLAARRAPVPGHAPARVGQEVPETFAAGGLVPPPPPPRDVDAPTWLDERGGDVLARIRFPWQRLGFDIDFAPARNGLRAVTYTRERRIVVFVRRGDSVAQTAFDLAHELGHAFDLVHGNWPRRQRWLELRGIATDTPWFGCSGCDDLATGAGDFAEVFALWQVGAVDFASRLAPAPSAAELTELAELFAPGWTSRSDPTRTDNRGGGGAGQPPSSGGSGGEDGPGGSGPDGTDDGSGDHQDGDGRGDDRDDGGDGDGDDDGDGPVPCPILCDRPD